MQDKYIKITDDTLKDPYFIEKSAGGLNPCIRRPKGSTQQVQNCVYWAWYCFCSYAGKALLASTNAENFVDVAKSQGLEVGAEPKLGAIACWSVGKVGNGTDGAGHVAFVVDVSENSITTSESGWSYTKSATWLKKRTKGDDGNWGQPDTYKFLGFIYQPAKNTVRTLKKGDFGDDVKLLQEKLAALGYLRENEIDGDFGTITLGAVLAFQLESGLEVDGVCGAKTKEKLGGL